MPADLGKALDFLCQRPSNVNKHVNKALLSEPSPQPPLQPFWAIHGSFSPAAGVSLTGEKEEVSRLRE